MKQAERTQTTETKAGGARRAFLARVFAFGACAVLLAGLSAWPAAAQVMVNRRLVAQAEQYTGDRFRFTATTPRGARVVTVSRPRAEWLRAVDDGLSELFAVARRHGYGARLNYADYTVFIARADRTRDSAGAYSPDVAYVAPGYAGSVYDQGGYIYAAGMTFSMEPPALVIAEHERDFQRMANVVRYEGEHLVLYHNDRRLFSQTADHSRGGGHPILQ
ncbi:MAG TPA: hypothetical protein VF546_01930 [Pyrinomonadaceae bacterium]|jgi:hypothetical protein